MAKSLEEEEVGEVEMGCGWTVEGESLDGAGGGAKVEIPVPIRRRCVERDPQWLVVSYSQPVILQSCVAAYRSLVPFIATAEISGLRTKLVG